MNLVFENLGKQFQHRWAIRGATGEAGSGDFISIVGPNGAGKTTLLRLLTQIYRPNEGKIEVNKTKTVFSFFNDSPMLYPSLNAVENLEFLLGLYQRKAGREQIIAALDDCGLGQAREKKVEAFSTGMMQRLHIASLLCLKPEIVFLDEPFNGLDLQGQQLLFELIKQGGRSWQIETLVLIDHDIKRALELTSQTWLVKGAALNQPEKRTLGGLQRELA